MRFVQTRVAALGLGIIGLAAAGAVAPAAAEGSYVDALAAALSSQGTGTSIPPVGKTGASGTNAYSTRASVLMFSEAMGLVSKGNIIGEMSLVASGMAMHASNNGPIGPTVLTEADTTIASVDMVLTLFPATASAPTPAPLLTLKMSKLAAKLTDTQTLPLASVQTGTASFGLLTLSGSLIGNQTLTFTGDAPANTVLYDDQYLTVTLNQQIVTGTIVCTPFCQFIPQSIVANAVAVQMHNEPIAGKPATGDVFIGQTVAAVP